MPQDAFTLRHVAHELHEALKGGKINKINQPEKEELSLIIYTGKRTVKLVLNVNASDCGVYFTEDEKENPLTAPNFCMLLRKHLQNAEILSVEQVAFERIIAFRLNCTSDFSACERTLYAEIMGKYSNLVLVEAGRVMGALKTTSLGAELRRVLMTGATYVLPAPQGKTMPTDLDGLNALLSAPQGDMARFLFENVAGLAPTTAEQMCRSYTGGNFAEHVHSYIFSDERTPFVRIKDGAPTDFYARYEGEDGVRFATVSEAQSYFYGRRRNRKAMDALRRKLEHGVCAVKKKQEKRLAQILEKQRECDEMEQNRIKGELLTANLYQLRRGEKSCELYNYYDEQGKMLKIALDDTLSPAQNAQKYYKKYQKQKRTLEALLPQEKEVRAELDYCQSLLSAVAVAKSEEDLRAVEEELTSVGMIKAPPVRGKKKKEDIPYRLFERGGFRILAGRNNLQNDRLVKSSAPDDIWLHTQKYHSAHVVVQTQGKKLPDEILGYAASICARYSDGKSGNKIPVDYCEVKRVKKPNGAKAGFVIYTDYQTVLVDPLDE